MRAPAFAAQEIHVETVAYEMRGGFLGKTRFACLDIGVFLGFSGAARARGERARCSVVVRWKRSSAVRLPQGFARGDRDGRRRLVARLDQREGLERGRGRGFRRGLGPRRGQGGRGGRLWRGARQRANDFQLAPLDRGGGRRAEGRASFEARQIDLNRNLRRLRAHHRRQSG